MRHWLPIGSGRLLRIFLQGFHLLVVHWALFAIMLGTTVLLFANLGEESLWADEGDTAVFAHNILRYGVPTAWDGVTFIDSDRGERLNQELVMISTPWVPYYVTAASFALLGETAFSARFPFALAGLATLPLLYVLMLRYQCGRRAAALAVLLTGTSVPFLIYSRQCRYYSLCMLLTCLAVWLFPAIKGRLSKVCFVIVLILLSHSQPLPGVALLFAFAWLVMMDVRFEHLRTELFLCGAVVALAVLPLMVLGWTGWQTTSTLPGSFDSIATRSLQYVIELAAMVPWLAWIVLTLVAHRRIDPQARAYLALTLAVFVFYGILLVASQRASDLWVVGLRYACGAIPLAAGVTAVLITRAIPRSGLAQLAVVAILTTTHFGANAFIWPFVDPRRAFVSEVDSQVGIHTPVGTTARFVRMELVGFLRELWQSNPGTVRYVCDFLRRHCRPQDIIITNYEWEPVYFHTKLPQGMKVLREYPIYRAARSHRLPDYVFNPRHARWIVWREPWNTYQGYDFNQINKALARDGKELKLEAKVPETTCENRENVHFRRFPGLGHLYWPGNIRYPDVKIFRVFD